ncbi:MAG: HAD-IC family P-type ATPase [Candidatus Lokiarchaeota archaeon]|nr:HAD-IC family P-type ATPase [Candidatus Lokiarchaeota archaeon]MBD3202530.1 HAD-IC family P-type ATPase [Candidatus Lokiarchaeota archaeon]
MKAEELNVHALKTEEVTEELETDIQNGLSEEEAQKRLEKYGPNELKETKRVTAWEIFFSQFKDFLIYLLFFAIAVSIIIGFYEISQGNEPSEFVDALVIFIILIVNAILGFYQEYKAEQALESLKKMAPRYAKVIRDGKVREIDIEDVVPGDIIQIDEGDKIPADARLTKAYSLYADEAILTGESQPVEKELKIYDVKTMLADRKNMVFSNTIITRGNGKAIVVRTGMDTEVGKIAEKIQQDDREKSPFQKEVDVFGKKIGILILIICAIVFLIEVVLIVFFPEGGNQFDKIIEAFKIAISLAVSAVPEGLVVVITVVMSIGMRKMAARNALVKTLTAVETLGRVNIICSDKTGTLTKNEMTVQKVYIGGKEYDIEGIGYNLEGGIIDDSGKAVKIDDNVYLKRYLEVCELCNNSTVTPREDNPVKTDVIGDPTEISLKVLAKKMNIETNAEKIDEIPFNSDRKMMSVVVKIDGQLFSLIKGAPDVLIQKAGKGLLNGEIKDISEIKENYLSKNNNFAEEALRVLGIAYKPLNEGYSEEEIEQDFIYLGLAGIIDPARDEVKNSIKIARKAGIRTIMITGDHKITAIAIANEIGLTDKEEAITGAELEEMTDEELIKRLENTDIFARVTSEHKLRILKTLKSMDYIVSMTGDGVNDAPAVKGANVGVSMGIKGTEVTQEASDMILLDDDYSTIVAAIEEGRGIFETTKGFFRYMLSTNFDEIFLILVAYIVIKFFSFAALPITPIQILWLNIATDGIPAMVLGFTPTDPDVMNDKPREGFSLITEIKGPVLFLGIYTSITDITLYLLLWFVLFPAWAQAGIDPNLTMAYVTKGSVANIYATSLSQTIIFTNLVVCELLFVYSCTSNKKPFWLFPNKHLFWATALSFGLQLIILYTPLGIAFDVVPLLHPYYWFAVLIAGFSVVVVDELRKWRIRIKEGTTIFTS